MAIYHFSGQIIQRSKGYSAVAAAAYRAGDKLRCDYDGRTHDYTRRKGVVHSEIMLPDNAPSEYADRATLWNAVETTLKRKDAQLAREINIALPREFDLQEQIEVMRKYIKENFVDKGMCVDFAIHDSKDGNPHAHVMLTKNNVSEKGIGSKNYDWDKRDIYMKWRENWAAICNERFKEKGLDCHIDHRTLKEQGIDREPTIHVGSASRAMERKGIKTDRERINQEIIKRNESRSPAAVAEYMNELLARYEIVDTQLREGAEKRREADRLDFRANDMEKRFVSVDEKQERLGEAKKRRKGLKLWQSKVKEAIDAEIRQYETFIANSRDFFKNKYKVELEGVAAEIERHKTEAAVLRREISGRVELAKTRDIIAIEYHKQWLLAEIRPDGNAILSRLKNPPPQLRNISNSQFEKILSEVPPAQVKILKEQRERDVVRSKIHERER